jgi:electron-transferring-flavoprotein dehydrogenase
MEVDKSQHRQGHTMHTIGWPMDSKTYGGSWLYHMQENKVSIGFVMGLDYTNPWISPFEEMQRFKTHPLIRPILTGGGASHMVPARWWRADFSPFQN